MERLAPLEERVRDELLIRIRQNHLGWKKQLPSEAELAKEYGVSRATIRAALSTLSAQGIVIRKQGSGTYINHAMLRLRLEVSEQWEFQDLIKSTGYEPGIRFIDSEISPAGSEEAFALGVDEGKPVLIIRKIFTADEKPAIHSTNIISLTIAPPPHDIDKLHGPIFPYLQEAYGQEPIYSVTDILPIVADQQMASLLQVPLGSPLLLFKDTFYNNENQPIMYGHNIFTNILHFKAIRQPYSNRM